VDFTAIIFNNLILNEFNLIKFFCKKCSNHYKGYTRYNQGQHQLHLSHEPSRSMRGSHLGISMMRHGSHHSIHRALHSPYHSINWWTKNTGKSTVILGKALKKYSFINISPKTIWHIQHIIKNTSSIGIDLKHCCTQQIWRVSKTLLNPKLEYISQSQRNIQSNYANRSKMANTAHTAICWNNFKQIMKVLPITVYQCK